ncbi:MAG: hypothetical protein K0S44_176 [Bacteroidetes bacterium]|nr:hypothetical protein [Bacteroidota bacterium]
MLFFTCVLKAQITFEKSYGGPGSEFAWGTTQCADGGSISVGSTDSYGAGILDVYVVRTSVNGSVLWTKTFGGSNMEFGTSIIKTADNNFLLTGYTNSFGNGFDIYVIKIDEGGNLLWSATYGGVGDQMAYGIENNGSGCVITGKTDSYGVGDFDGFILALQNDGSVNWFKNYGGINEECFTSIKRTSDNGFCLAGTTTSFGSGFQDGYVLKVDNEGNKEWSKAFGGSDTDYTSSVKQTADGNYIITGGSYSYGPGSGDALIVKLNSYGEVIWQNTFGGPGVDSGNDIIEAGNGGYVMLGHTGSSSDNFNVYIIKTTVNGDIEFSRSFGDNGSDIGYHIERAGSTGYVICGELNGQVYLLKLNSNCRTSCSNDEFSQSSPSALQFTSPTDHVQIQSSLSISVVQTILSDGGAENSKCYNEITNTLDGNIFTPIDSDLTHTIQESFIERENSQLSPSSAKPISENNTSLFEVYPNPNSGENIYVKLESESAGKLILKIYDQLGRTFYSDVLIPGTYENTFIIEPQQELLPGIYMLTATTDNRTFSTRLIIK